jgi:hypothetical protein
LRREGGGDPACRRQSFTGTAASRSSTSRRAKDGARPTERLGLAALRAAVGDDELYDVAVHLSPGLAAEVAIT